MKYLQNNTEDYQNWILENAKLYLFLKDKFQPLIGRKLIVSDDFREPKKAKITDFEVRAGIVEKSEVIINSMEDLDKFDKIHELVRVQMYAIYNHNNEKMQVFYEALYRMNPSIFLNSEFLHHFPNFL